MSARALIVLAAAFAGMATAVLFPGVPREIRQIVGLAPAVRSETPPSADAIKGASPLPPMDGGKVLATGKVTMTAEQIAAAGIAVSPIGDGTLIDHIMVPGTVTANVDKLARVTARVGGIVADVRKRLGSSVSAGETLAVIESREIADAKGEFLAAGRTAKLAEVTLARETKLWQLRISAEQDLLQARAKTEEARIRLDLGRQRLSALGLSDAEIEALPHQPVAALRRLEVRAPIAGRITERAAVTGAAVAADAELFSIADLATVWVEMVVPPRDLPLVREGQAVTAAGEGGAQGEGRVVFLNPFLDAQTRSARAVAEFDNHAGTWRPGAFTTVSFAAVERKVPLLAPRAAVHEVGGKKVVFVRSADGFEQREVTLGGEGEAAVEVVSGLEPGVEIAVSNTFALRAELGRAQAED
ncbi:MAG: efflux RND transporter periplasmic adaptor subunit [Alphaproteobacteria bacterium]|nr:efflux RND transporter periplasmic adaptor subunit [Alphaproteobacteria bacterium]